MTRQTNNAPAPAPAPAPALTDTSRITPFIGTAARIADAANKSLSKENARLVKQVIGGLALASAAAGATLTTIVYDTAKTEKNIVKKTLLYAAVLGNAALVVESLVQSGDLLGTPLFLCEEDDSIPGCPPNK